MCQDFHRALLKFLWVPDPIQLQLSQPQMSVMEEENDVTHGDASLNVNSAAEFASCVNQIRSNQISHYCS